MNDITERIAAWEAAGLIDGAVADRLRAAEASASEGHPGQAKVVPDTTAHPRSAASALFGPSVTIAEVFAYLGGAFLLAAWSSFMTRSNGPSGEPGAVLGVMALLAAGVLGVIGLRLMSGEERASRASGVAFLLVSTYVATAAAAFGNAAGLDWPALGVVGSAVGLATAIALRVVHPAAMTQVGVLAWLTALGVSMLAWLQVTLFPENFSPETGLPTSTGPDPLLLVVATAAWWLATAVVIALIGLREAQVADRDTDPGAGRRAAISRFWAGLTAVIGLWQAISRSAGFADGEYGRVVEPWIGDLALLALSAILVERAFRRDATSFIYAAALGLLIALTDFNLAYLSGSTEAALLIEGLILLAVGVAADRLRRRVGRDGTPAVGVAAVDAAPPSEIEPTALPKQDGDVPSLRPGHGV
ncbi:MAG: hypothetical protein ABI562_06020 [Chloroflexota bacterium]